MKRHRFLVYLFLISLVLIWTGLICGASGTEQKKDSRAGNSLVLEKMSSLRIPFIANEGQVDNEVGFYAKALGGTLFVTRKADLVYCIPMVEEKKDDLPQEETEKQRRYKPCVIKERFGGNLNSSPKGTGRAETKVNYFKGNDKSKWKSNISTYNEVSLGEIYSGISLILRAYGNNVEKIFTVGPGSRPESIKVKLAGAKRTRITEKGELEIETGIGAVKFTKPVAYQKKGRGKEFVQVAYVVKGNEYGFKVGDYDRTKDLVIDPALSYSTYLGGSGNDSGYAVAVDSNGCAYVAGKTGSDDFPTQTPYQGDKGSDDAFVTKLNADGSALVYSTYLGGADNDYGYGIAVDGSGCAYVTGETSSADFPTQTPYQSDQFSNDAFVTKLNADGSALVYSTYLGGSENDYGYAIAVDESGCAYVTGETASPDFPTLNAYQTDQGADDVFVTKLNTAGNALSYSTYLGGADNDYGYGIAVDGSGCAYVTGKTASPDFPTVSPFQGDQGSYDAFVTKLNAAGSAPTYSTYLGGAGGDCGYGIAVDKNGCAYVTGYTLAADFPTQTPIQTDQNGGDAFVTKLGAAGNALSYSTYLGGADNDYGYGIAVDESGCAYVTGETASPDFPTLNAYQGNQVATDAFATMLNPYGALSYSTYLGGAENDSGNGIAVDESGWYVTGETSSADFPTLNAYQADQGADDVFATKLTADLSVGDLGEWKFDGSGNNGVPGGPAAVLVAGASLQPAGGISAGYAYIPSGADSVEIPWHSAFDLPNSFTIEFWFRQRADRAFVQDLIYKGTSPNSYNFRIFRQLWDASNDGEVIAGFGNTTPSWIQVSNPNQLAHNAWHYVAYTKDAGGHAYYLDGNLIESSATIDAAIIVASQLIIICDSAVDTDIDELRISSTALTATQISDYYALFVPVADAGLDQTLNEGLMVTLDASNSSDPNDGIASYQWTQTTGTSVTLSDATAIQPTFTAPDIGPGGDALTFKLTVTDNAGLQSTDTCVVNVTWVNLAPTAEAGTDQTVDERTAVTLDGSNSSDPDDGIASYQWTQTAGTSVTLSDATAIQPTFTAPDLESGGEALTFKLTVTDNAGLQSQDTCVVNVTGNASPNTPTAVSPASESIFDAGPVTLDTSDFSDPEEDTHAKTYWLVRRADNPLDTSLDHVATTAPLTQHEITGLITGMKYIWKVGYEDSNGNISWSQEYAFTIGVSVMDTGIPIPAGREVEDFKMVSFVHWPDNPAAASVFGVDYASNDFRIGTYDPTSGAYVEYGSDFEIMPGRAYWVLARDGLDITVEGVPVSLDADIEVWLLYNSSTGEGWNMIACPNNANYYWADVQVVEYNANGSIKNGPTAVSALSDPNDYIDKQLWRWENGSYYSDTTFMEKHEGYWVKAKKANVYLRFPKAVQQAQLSNHGIMYAGLLDRTKRWITRSVFTPQAAIAEPEDSPPPPMADFDGNTGSDSATGCFIAAAAYGSPMAPHFKELRQFRDRFLLTNAMGKKILRLYYACSPPVADFIAENDGLQQMVCLGLLPLMGVSWVALKLGPLPALVLTLLFLALISAIAVVLLIRSQMMRLRQNTWACYGERFLALLLNKISRR